MKPLLFVPLLLPALLLAASPANADGKLVPSERINSAEGYVFQSKRYGQLRLTGLSVRKDQQPKCMVDVSGIEQMIAREQAAKTLNIRPMPGKANGVIITMYLEYRTAGGVPTCVGKGPDCEMEVVLPDKSKLL
jgi:hypothetical protein